MKIPALLALCFVLCAADWPNHSLIDQAQQEKPDRVEYAIKYHAQIGLTPDGKSFYLLWLPEGSDPKNPPPIVAGMHGHGSWAFDEFYVWHDFLAERGYGLLAVQWWLGKGERFQDYLTPNEIYRTMDEVLKQISAKPGTVMLHGYSRGSANSYAVAAFDRKTGNNYFALCVANAGKPGLDFPPNKDIQNGRMGPLPLSGTHWVTYAGGKDPHPERDGIQGMREAAEWIKTYGGVVDLMIEDPNGGHGGFHHNPENVKKALDAFRRRMV